MGPSDDRRLNGLELSATLRILQIYGNRAEIQIERGLFQYYTPFSEERGSPDGSTVVPPFYSLRTRAMTILV